jgi:hypothetical protein
MHYRPIDLSRHKSDVLVLHCADPRFQKAYREVIDSLGKYYDLLVMPGASKAVVENPTTIDYIKLLHSLHHFDEVHIMDHIECGAFGKIDDEISSHSEMLKIAENKIKKAVPELGITSHLLGEDQELDLEQITQKGL